MHFILRNLEKMPIKYTQIFTVYRTEENSRSSCMTIWSTHLRGFYLINCLNELCYVGLNDLYFHFSTNVYLKNYEIKHSFIQQLRPNTSLRRTKSSVKTLRQPFLESPIYSTLLPPSLPTYPMNPSSKSMARDKHKSPIEVTYRKQFEPADPS